MPARICPECAERNPVEWLFCGSCGAHLDVVPKIRRSPHRGGPGSANKVDPRLDIPARIHRLFQPLEP